MESGDLRDFPSAPHSSNRIQGDLFVCLPGGGLIMTQIEVSHFFSFDLLTLPYYPMQLDMRTMKSCAVASYVFHQ